MIGRLLMIVVLCVGFLVAMAGDASAHGPGRFGGRGGWGGGWNGPRGGGGWGPRWNSGVGFGFGFGARNFGPYGNFGPNGFYQPRFRGFDIFGNPVFY